MKRIQYSKFLPPATFVLLCACIYLALTDNIDSIEKLSLYATIITVTGTICLTSIVWYLKNSQAEKVANIKANTFKIASEERYNYNAKMLKLKKEYNCSDEEIDELEAGSPMDEIESDALNGLTSSVDSAMDDATSVLEIQNIN